MNHDGQERGRLQCAVSHDGQEHSRLQNAVSHDGQEHMASCAINHDQERTTDHSVQWTMMVRNASQNTICNEPWWSGTHRRSQCAMNHGREHMVNQCAMNHGYNAHLVSSTSCNAGPVSATNLKFCILSSFHGTEHVLSTLPWLQCLLSHHYHACFVALTWLPCMFFQHFHGYHACFVSISMVTMQILSAFWWLWCQLCQHFHGYYASFVSISMVIMLILSAFGWLWCRLC